jgi:hypothetical protein
MRVPSLRTITHELAHEQTAATNANAISRRDTA